MPSAFVALEGIVGTEDKIRGFHPAPEGLRFVSNLSQTYKVLLSVVDQNKMSMEHWLHLNGLAQGIVYDRILYPDPGDKLLTPGEQRWNQLNRARASGSVINFAVSADPEFVERSVKEGMTTLLWLSPAYSRLDFQPGAKPVKPWDAILEEQEKQLDLRRTDQRLAAEAEGEF